MSIIDYPLLLCGFKVLLLYHEEGEDANVGEKYEKARY